MPCLPLRQREQHACGSEEPSALLLSPSLPPLPAYAARSSHVWLPLRHANTTREPNPRVCLEAPRALRNNTFALPTHPTTPLLCDPPYTAFLILHFLFCITALTRCCIISAAAQQQDACNAMRLFSCTFPRATRAPCSQHRPAPGDIAACSTHTYHGSRLGATGMTAAAFAMPLRCQSCPARRHLSQPFAPMIALCLAGRCVTGNATREGTMIKEMQY